MDDYTDYDIGILNNDEMDDDFLVYPHQHHHHCSQTASDRINAFMNVKGVPYILNDYLENIIFKQIDQAFISNSLSISEKESGRIVVDISLDDTKPIIGNRVKYSRLIESVFKSVCGNKHNILSVIQKPLIAQIEYRIENQRTGEIIKSAVEKLSIKKRDYFIDINVKSISDNAIDNSILTNFKDALTTTVAEFLHGSEFMICRITGLSLFYATVPCNHHHNHDGHHINIQKLSNDHHHHHHDCDNYQYNNLYHFENNGDFIHLHQEDIEDKSDNNVILVPVGSIKFDKVFKVVTGQKITFNYSIWKSDVIMVQNCRRIAEILGGSPHRKVHKTIEDILDKLEDIKQTTRDQDIKLSNVLNILDNTMNEDNATELSNTIINSYGKEENK